MNRKDPSSVDLVPAEPASDPIARRNLFVRAGAAGVAGLVAALAVDHSALASPDPVVRPNVPTEADISTLDAAIRLELAASELYRAAAANASGDVAAAAGVMAENHQAYAQAISGDTGLSAQEADAAIVETFMDAFVGSNTDFFTAAHQLEQSAVSTHTALLADYESIDAVTLTASILVVEARHATVLADLLGVVEDLDVVFGNTQPALSLSGDA